jgi:hypothetical protein
MSLGDTPLPCEQSSYEYLLLRQQGAAGYLVQVKTLSLVTPVSDKQEYNYC